MDELTPTPPPGKVQAIGAMHLVAGIMNVIASLFWALYGVLMGVATFGVGLLFCCPAFILLPIGIMEIISGSKHLSKNHAGLKPPRMTAFAENSAILGCGMISCVMGVLTLVFLNDPEVAAYYEKQRLGG